ncbi:MAG: PEPxxWA-CTERM sorting domain-containing protein, partial [Sphingomonas bacterium]|nr:PEPxxWA-CTERM sorting domain-containing protein [Sphingomonas bacterium]
FYNPDGFELGGIIFSYSPDRFTFTQENFDLGQANFLAALNGSINVYSITLTGLSDGFTVDYSYSAGALGDIGTSGFNLPSGLNETTGPLVNSSFRFGGDGQLLTAAVPEPATWLSMLLGFALTGAALRRRTRVQLEAA